MNVDQATGWAFRIFGRVGVIFAIAGVGLGCRTASKAEPVSEDQYAAQTARMLPRRELPAPERLSLTARSLLSRRMENHGFEMTNLMWATLLLDRTAASSITQSILAEPRLSRPITRDGSELNAHLPTAFFDLQDQLVESAEELRAVADDQHSSPGELAEAFGRLTNTCVRCHAVYLYGQ